MTILDGDPTTPRDLSSWASSPSSRKVAISGVLVQPFRLFWYGENDVLVQRRPEVIST
jgi:hypothetical protein